MVNDLTELKIRRGEMRSEKKNPLKEQSGKEKIRKSLLYKCTLVTLAATAETLWLRLSETDQLARKFRL
jgi:hypothetical protein